MEFGITTFVDLNLDPRTGQRTTPEQRVRDLLEEAELADQVGLDVLGVGEHHRPDFLASAPTVMLAAIAARTKHLRLTSAVTVLSSNDPVRVFQEFSTLDLISGGRAEIMAGRGSFIESFPLFGYDLRHYDELFIEKLELLLKLRTSEVVTWTGKHRPSFSELGIYPRPVQQPLPVWIAVGGTPQSVVRAGTLGLPLAVAIIGGHPERFAPLVDLYREAGQRAGHDPSTLKVCINSHGFIADTVEQAIDTMYEPYAAVMSRIGRERGWPPLRRQQFDAMRARDGSLILGGPAEVVDKILFEYELFRNERTLLQFSVGALPHDALLKSIELFGTKVVPEVRRAIGG